MSRADDHPVGANIGRRIAVGLWLSVLMPAHNALPHLDAVQDAIVSQAPEHPEIRMELLFLSMSAPTAWLKCCNRGYTLGNLNSGKVEDWVLALLGMSAALEAAPLRWDEPARVAPVRETQRRRMSHITWPERQMLGGLLPWSSVWDLCAMRPHLGKLSSERAPT